MTRVGGELAAEQARLEREVASLERALESAHAKLDDARRAPLRPRGLVEGALVGVALLGLLVAGGMVVLMWFVVGMD